MSRAIKIELIVALCFLLSSCSSQIECNKFTELTLQGLESEFKTLAIADQAHELYLYGQCAVDTAKPILERFKDSQKVSHHLQHKGMSLGEIASKSLGKLRD